jgi:hypothetical protein
MENDALVAPLPRLSEYCFQKNGPTIRGQVWGETRGDQAKPIILGRQSPEGCAFPMGAMSKLQEIPSGRSGGEDLVR